MKTDSHSNGKMQKNTLILAFAILLYFPAYTQIQWVSVENMGSLDINKNTKLGFIDFSTTWCSWCKKMDKETLSNPIVANILNTYYHAARFDAENKDTIQWKGAEYTNPDPSGRNVIHSFTRLILSGKISFPTFAILDSKMNTLIIIQGFYPAEDFIKILWFFASNDYKKYSFDKYKIIFDEQIRLEMNKKLALE